MARCAIMDKWIDRKNESIGRMELKDFRTLLEIETKGSISLAARYLYV